MPAECVHVMCSQATDGVQLKSLQVCSAGPSHALPCKGTGLRQKRHCLPPPHVLVQPPMRWRRVPHSVQPPLRQPRVSVLGPLHAMPPFSGVGCVHVRVRFALPSASDLPSWSHRLHVPQAVQPHHVRTYCCGGSCRQGTQQSCTCRPAHPCTSWCTDDW